MQIKILISGLIFLMGCETTPETMFECEQIFIVEQEILACKERVIQREDRRFDRTQRELMDEALSKRCWQVQRGIWDQRTGTCKDWNML